jgi:hypothetical protein
MSAPCRNTNLKTIRLSLPSKECGIVCETFQWYTKRHICIQCKHTSITYSLRSSRQRNNTNKSSVFKCYNFLPLIILWLIPQRTVKWRVKRNIVFTLLLHGHNNITMKREFLLAVSQYILFVSFLFLLQSAEPPFHMEHLQ